MKYICNHCSKEFDELEENKQIQSLFVRQLVLCCPYCKHVDIRLTSKGELLITRKKKINKINGE